MREKFLIFGQPLIEQDEMDEVLDSMKKAWLGTGPKVLQFEKNFAGYKNIDHVAAVNSCTAALHLSCLSLGLHPGDEIITTPMTFCATVNAILHSGARPVFADIDPVTLNIDVNEIEKKITSKTRAIMVVHFAGRACDMDPIIELAGSRNIALIEDCAHAIETSYKGRKAGTFGHAGCFSFYATKNITTGEGGMVISHDENFIKRVKIMALHGLSSDAWKRYSDLGYKHYYVEEAGFKYNMMDVQAAIGIHQLKRIEEYWKRRERIWHKYMDAFADLGLGLPAPVEKDTRHAYHLFTVRINSRKTGLERDEFLVAMTAKNIGVGVHYLSIPEHPYYQKHLSLKPEDYPHAFSFGRETVSLPISPKLTDQDVDDVISAVRSILLNNRR
ncbi:MAG: UDP-4-amino-4,6-dideoxy-N-acetyl-beta-L-altrosamine transaminase [Desulfobacterales bacterium SG8_35_2]|nr:MAG: UDP-4-amino-4,6-dideoxy-N-acetyl-beta-L-altrosamine transaminase [Desulfobacterales bacterium SG8_35_2]